MQLSERLNEVYLILAVVTNNHNEGSMFILYSILDKSVNARVYCFFNHFICAMRKESSKSTKKFVTLCVTRDWAKIRVHDLSAVFIIK
jgi:hypothetical protein